VFGGIAPTRHDDGPVQSVVVRLDELNIGSCVGVVIWFDVGDNGLLGLEVRFADARRVLVAAFQCRGAAEEECEDGVPGQQPWQMSVTKHLEPQREQYTLYSPRYNADTTGKKATPLGRLSPSRDNSTPADVSIKMGFAVDVAVRAVGLALGPRQ